MGSRLTEAAWKEAVLEACVVACIGFDENDPRKTLANLLNWEASIALDPAVSSDARALIERGRKEAHERQQATPRGAAEGMA